MTYSSTELDAALRSEFPSFVRKVFHELHPGAPFDDNWHLDALSHQLDLARAGDTKRLIINVPPRSLKSLFASVALPAFVLGRDPTARLVCVSYAQSLAAKMSRQCRQVLTSSWYRRVFPETVISKDTEDLIETTRGGSRLATSVGGVATGFGGGFIIIDDPMKPDEGWSAAAREKASRYYRETLTSRLDSKLHGVIILVMQRLHADDLAGYLLRERPGKWVHLNLPAIAPEDRTIELGGDRTYFWKEGEALQLTREPHPVLDDLREEQGSLVFQAQWLQDPAPEGGLMVKKGDVIFYERQPSLALGQVYQSWDTALSGDSSACYSVCTTWLRIGNQHFLIDVFRERLTFPELLRAATDLYQGQRPEAVLIENKGSGMSLIQQLRADTGMTTIGLTPHKDKLTRLVTVLPMFEARQVLLPADKPWLPELLQELHGFPGERYNDQVDSISQYLNWAREQSYGGFSYDFGNLPAEPDESANVGWEPFHIPIQRWG